MSPQIKTGFSVQSSGQMGDISLARGYCYFSRGHITSHTLSKHYTDDLDTVYFVRHQSHDIVFVGG